MSGPLAIPNDPRMYETAEPWCPQPPPEDERISYEPEEEDADLQEVREDGGDSGDAPFPEGRVAMQGSGRMRTKETQS